jgi:hypothetical protein
MSRSRRGIKGVFDLAVVVKKLLWTVSYEKTVVCYEL